MIRPLVAIAIALPCIAHAQDEPASQDQAKIAEAFGTIQAADLVMTNEKGAGDYCNFEPGPEVKEQRPRVQAAKLPRGARVGFNPSGGIIVEYTEGRHGPPAGTPGIAWSTLHRLGQGEQIMFVAFDGGRYVCGQDGVERWDPARALPAPLADSALSFDELAALAKADQIPAKLAAALDAKKAAAEACATRVIARFEPKFTALQAADLRDETRQNRLDQLVAAQDRAVYTTCKSALAQTQSAWADAVSAHEALRRTTAAAFAARFAKPSEHP